MRWSLAILSAALVAMAPRGAGAVTSDLPAPCDDDRDCAPYPDNPWCDPNGSCFRCSGDTDCTGMDEVCTGGACVVPCVDAMDCTAAEPICHEEICVECLDNGGCLESEFCAGGLCVSDVCAQGETRCVWLHGTLVICNADGSGWDPLEDCVGQCEIVDDVARCEPVDTTSGSGGSTSADASTGGTTTSGGTTTGGGAATPDDDSSGAGEPMGSDDASKEGCGCRAASDAAGFGWLLLVLFRRRRSAGRSS